MSKSQSRTTHVGLAGEHLVASLLSPYCIVRTVGQGKDSGIDLYCEILKPGTLELSLHFFCQVKTIKGPLGNLDEQDLSYWAGQPVPVFVFHVDYREITTINDDRDIWVYDVPYLLAKKDAENAGQALSRDVDEKFRLCDQDDNKEKMKVDSFLYKHVPFSYGVWRLRRHGVVEPNSEVLTDQGPVFVGGLTNTYRVKIQQAMNYATELIRREDANV